MRKQSGFTLIELMIVIAILGILMAIAIPAYSDYTIRAKVSEGIALAAGAKLGVSEYRLSEAKWPTTNIDAGLNETIDSTYIETLLVGAAGVITIKYQAIGKEVDESTLILVPTMEAGAGALTWACGDKAQSIDNRYVPSSCRS